MISFKSNNTWAFVYDTDSKKLINQPSTGNKQIIQDAKGRSFVCSAHATEEACLSEIEALGLITNEGEEV